MACIRSSRLLFEGLSFALDAGKAALVVGPNGAGKSSLLRLAAGLLAPAAGKVAVSGRLAFTPADVTALDPRATLSRALSFWARLDGRDDAAARSALDAMGIADLAEVPVRMLSTGQHRRAALVRTLASGAAIWLLDEPANGLDSDGLDRLSTAISAHRASGGIVLAATHQPLGIAGAQEIAL